MPDGSRYRPAMAELGAAEADRQDVVGDERREFLGRELAPDDLVDDLGRQYEGPVLVQKAMFSNRLPESRYAVRVEDFVG